MENSSRPQQAAAAAAGNEHKTESAAGCHRTTFVRICRCRQRPQLAWTMPDRSSVYPRGCDSGPVRRASADFGHDRGDAVDGARG